MLLKMYLNLLMLNKVELKKNNSLYIYIIYFFWVLFYRLIFLYVLFNIFLLVMNFLIFFFSLMKMSFIFFYFCVCLDFIKLCNGKFCFEEKLN